MNIEKLFLKPIDRAIEGVIKADDDSSLFDEIDEYVVTDEVARCLDEFLDYYNDYKGVNGAWISGFFGSGKSHLLKILSMVLEDRPLLGDLSSSKLFLEKFQGDGLLKGAMEKAISIPSKSVLFNIDHKSNQTDAVLPVFIKVFNEVRGYYGLVPSIAKFECDLDKKGQYGDFKEAFLRISGETWESQRDAIWLSPEVFAQALSETTGISEEDASKVLDRYEDNYKVAIEDFALDVKDYIDRQGPNFRLNFFVDEVGQYVADDVKLMTNLQSIAETLNTKCRGRAWILVTSQGDMEAVLGQWGKGQGDDFSKIQDRFKCRMNLTSANVEEVIRKRLLDKKEDVKPELRALYEEQRQNYRTLFGFGEGSRSYRDFTDESHFVDIYPFLPYQFDLFQAAIRNLSANNAFEGKHRSVGERSMLGVFQMAAKAIGDRETGQIASFDLFYEGIQKALVSQRQSDINVAEKNISGSRLAVRLLKTLLLVKYVKEFRATARNLSILLIDRFDTNPVDHEKEVKEALNLLERNTYVQRNGEIYEFLTDEEKDIESEIKNVDLDPSEINNLLADIIFKDILTKLQKVRYEENGQDYPLARKLDGTLTGRDYELSINVVTQLNDRYGNLDAIAMDSFRTCELTVILPGDRRLVDDLTLYRKTEKYNALSTGVNMKESVKRILSSKVEQNQKRKEELNTGISHLIAGASFIIRGQNIDVSSSEDPEARVNSALQHLVSIVYPNIRMLGKTFKEEDISRILKEKKDDLFIRQDEVMTEAESELLSDVERVKANGQRATVKGLIDKFAQSPYGWWQAAVLCVLSYLYVRGKVEIKQDSNLLDYQGISAAFGNSRNFGNLLIEPRVEYSQKEIKRLKDLHREFFDESNNGIEARDTCERFRNRLKEEVQHLDESIVARSRDYPFKETIKKARDTLASYGDREYSYYITAMDEFEDTLLDLKEDVIDPIKNFVNGDKRTIFDDIRSFLARHRENFRYIDSDELKDLKDIEQNGEIYRGNLIQQGKASLDKLRRDLTELLRDEKERAIKTIEETGQKLRTDRNYLNLEDREKADIERAIEKEKGEIKNSHVVPIIRNTANEFANERYHEFLKSMVKATPNPPKDEKGDQEKKGDVRVAQRRMIPRNSIPVPFHKNSLETEEDLDLYLKNLRSQFLRQIEDNGRIML